MFNYCIQNIREFKAILDGRIVEFGKITLVSVRHKKTLQTNPSDI